MQRLGRAYPAELDDHVARGAERVAPMLAAIEGGYVTHVVTSEAASEALLALAGTGAP